MFTGQKRYVVENKVLGEFVKQKVYQTRESAHEKAIKRQSKGKVVRIREEELHVFPDDIGGGSFVVSKIVFDNGAWR